MNWSVLSVLGLFILFSGQTHGAACVTSSASTGTGAADGTNCTVSGTQSTIQLNFISGFNSSTSLSAVGGNGGTTLGAQRMLSFIKAVEIISDQVASTQTIIIDANFTSLECVANSATLGSAGPSVSQYHPSPPVGITADTWYPIGLYNHLANSDSFSAADDIAGGYTGNGSGSDIKSEFNSDIGTPGCLEGSSGWYYGFDDTPNANYIGFTTVLLHEITHGLGFVSLVSPYNGSKSSGRDDVFSNNLYDDSLGAWSGLTDAQRADTVVSVTGLLWSGNNVNTGAIGLLTNGFKDTDSDSGGTFNAGDKVEMYAPCASAPAYAQYDYESGDCLYEQGSSISHFSTEASPNELMEPQYTEYTDSLGLALYLLQDIGWTISAANSAPAWSTIPNQNLTVGDTASINLNSYASDADGDSMTYTGCESTSICSISSNTLTINTGSVASESITITANDDNGGATDSASFSISISAANSAPTWSTIPDQNLTVGDTASINLNSYASDADGDSMTYTGCESTAICSISSNTLTINTGSVASESITITANDGEGGSTDSASFTINIVAANSAPSWTTIPTQNLTVGDTATINLNSYATDGDGDSMTYTGCESTSICSISSNTLTINTASVASESITITANDGNGASTDSASFTINIVAANSAPSWTTIPTQNLTVGDTATINLNSYATDGDGDTMTYTGCESTSICSISSNTLTINTASVVSESITINANDGNGGSTDSASFNINITAAANNSPTITAVDQTTDEDTPLTIDTSGWGDDAEDTLTYSVLSNCAENITCSIDTDGTNLVMMPTANYNGTQLITITVDDNNNSTVSDTFNLTVSAVNDDPIIATAIADQTTNEDVALTFDVSNLASDVDTSDTLVYSIAACATGIDCEINSDGSTITLTPEADHNGDTHTITVSASDGNGGTAVSDSFNLTVTAVNDAPVLSHPGNMSLEINTSLTFDLAATDVEGDGITYSISSSPTEAGAIISNQSVTLLPTLVGDYQITVNASDGNLSSEQTFTLTAFEVPSIEVDGVNLEPSDSANIDNDEFTIDVSGAATNFSFSLDFDGNDVNNLLSFTGNNLTVSMPTSGQFAGIYTLTATDASTGYSYDYNLVRTPRLVFSASKLLSGQGTQTLTIEGGAPETVYTLNSSETALGFRENNADTTTVSASNDADSFNAAVVNLNVDVILNSTNVDVDVHSIFETASSTDLTLESALTHTLTVQDNDLNPLNQSTVTLDISTLAEFNLPSTYTSNASGISTIVLPDNGQDYSAEVSLSGFVSKTIALISSSNSQTITLQPVADPLNLSGNITASNGISFNMLLPSVMLTLDDGSEVSLPVTRVTDTQAEFDFIHDLNDGEVSSLTVTHPDSEIITLNLFTRSSLNFNILLTPRAQIVVVSSGESAGSINIMFLMLLLLILLPVTRRKRPQHNN